jgi:hypothetical protein
LPVWRKPAAAGLVLAVVVAVGLVAGGPAGAATELTLSPASGPPGTEFVVTGTGFAALPVEIRWSGLSGPVIATAMGPAFSVTAVVPDSPPNSHPVMAVVTDGNAVSTSSASFQVTGGEAPAETTTTTTTEVTTTTVAAAPASTTVPEPAASGTGRSTGVIVRGGSSGVGGGVDGGETAGDGPTGGGTTTGSGPASGSATPAGAGSTAAAPATTVAAAGATAPTVTLPIAGVPPPAPATGQPASTAPLLPGDGVTSAALAPRSTSQSARAVSNPALLVLGLSLVFGGGVFLAVRNRHRA